MRSTDTERTEMEESGWGGGGRRLLFVLTSSTTVLMLNTLFHLQPCKQQERRRGTGGEEEERRGRLVISLSQSDLISLPLLSSSGENSQSCSFASRVMNLSNMTNMRRRQRFLFGEA